MLDEIGFRSWLEARNLQGNSMSTRMSAVRGIERKLGELGVQYADLDKAFEADQLASTEEALKRLRVDADRGGEKFRVLLPESDTPVPRLTNFIAWLGNYRSFKLGTGATDRDADRIRQYVLANYIEPTRERAEQSVSVRVRDVHDALGLTQAWANVCQAIRGEKFQSLARVPPPAHEGPNVSPTTVFVFDLSAKHFKETDDVQPYPAPTNLILYGPPGTGKTYATAYEAVRLCDGKEPSDRKELMARYRDLVARGQIAFTTFHQSYAYEDFVEGLRPVTGQDPQGEEITPGFRLDPKPGIFREIATLAEEARKRGGGSNPFELGVRRVFKMSLGRAGLEDHIFDAAISGNYIALGWGGDIDWSARRYDDKDAIHARWNEDYPKTSRHDANISQLWQFRSLMREGDLVVISDGNSEFRAVAEVTGPYYFEKNDQEHYSHRRGVRWLARFDESLPADTIYGKAFSQRSCYQLQDQHLKRESLARLLSVGEQSPATPPDQFVLIIDEINRANISKVFGELITLIEAEKRLGAQDELIVTLPYSRRKFGVPSNLHIIGTMNTADRSIALLDTALRRRFTFRELMPEPAILSAASAACGVNLVRILTAMNQRVEYLFDREHQIGHAYFIHCRSRNDVDETMRARVIPLLAEYFYEDWSKVAAVLGDGNGKGRFLERTVLQPPAVQSAEQDSEPRYRWSVRQVFDPACYDDFQ